MPLSMTAAFSTVGRETEKQLTGLQRGEANIWAQYLQRSVEAVLSKHEAIQSEKQNLI